MMLINWLNKKKSSAMSFVSFIFSYGVYNMYSKIIYTHVAKTANSCVMYAKEGYDIYKKYYSQFDPELGDAREKLLANWPSDNQILLQLNKSNSDVFETKRKILAAVLEIDEGEVLERVIHKISYTAEGLRLNFEIFTARIHFSRLKETVRMMRLQALLKGVEVQIDEIKSISGLNQELWHDAVLDEKLDMIRSRQFVIDEEFSNMMKNEDSNKVSRVVLRKQPIIKKEDAMMNDRALERVQDFDVCGEAGIATLRTPRINQSKFQEHIEYDKTRLAKFIVLKKKLDVKLQADIAQLRQAQQVERDRMDGIMKQCQALEASNLEIVTNPNFIKIMRSRYVQIVLSRMTPQNLVNLYKLTIFKQPIYNHEAQSHDEEVACVPSP